MVEIYNIDISSHEQFARSEKAFETFRRQYHIPRSGERAIAVQTAILDLVPKPSALSSLFGLQQQISWASFPLFKDVGRFRTFSSYLVPSLGAPEKQDADIQRISLIVAQQKEKGDPTAEEEGQLFIGVLSEVKETNQMISFIVSQMFRFLQG